jgi:hypothetical protein
LRARLESATDRASRFFMSAPPLSRRTFLGAAAAGAALTIAPGAWAGSTSILRESTKDAKGVTLFLELDNAPYPTPGASYKDRTVIVFVPSHYRVLGNGRVDAIVHFHGFGGTAAESMRNHQLREQLFDSKQNAILVMPQGPKNAHDPAIGKLEQPGGFARFLTDLRQTLQRGDVRKALGHNAIPHGAKMGHVCVSAHSGGYHAAAVVLKHGGFDVNECYLFDSLYNDADIFKAWVIAGKGKSTRRRHKLVSYYGGGGTTASQSQSLLRELEKAGVQCAHETVEGSLTREDLMTSEAVFIRTGLSHGGVTHELNALRDCLFASGLTRLLKSTWFRKKREARKLDARPG